MRNRLLLILAPTLILILSSTSHTCGVFAQTASVTTSLGGQPDNKEGASSPSRDATQEQPSALPSPSPSPSPTPKSLIDSIADNPASLLGMVGAIVAALVTLISFIFNYRATLQGQRDTQFYEALKRFGDKDSPTTRASAAGLLALLGPKRSVLRLSVRPYLRIALDQLITALLLEKDPVVLTSMSNALRELVSWDRLWAAERAYSVNIQLQENLAESLAEYCMANDVSNSDGIDEELWAKAAIITGFDQPVLLSLIDQIGSRLSASPALAPQEQHTNGAGSSDEKMAIATKKKAQRLKSSTETLKIAATRLRHNISVCSTLLSEPFNTFSVVFKGIDPSEGKPVRNTLKLYGRLFTTPKTLLPMTRETYRYMRIKSKLQARGVGRIDTNYLYDKVKVFGKYDGFFLPKASLTYADISWLFSKGAQLQKATLQGAFLWQVDFEEAHMEGIDFSSAILTKVNLKKASLLEADFRKAKLESVKLTNAKLGGIKINNEISMKNTNWWMADFFERDGHSVNEETLEILYNKTGKNDIDSITAAHGSLLGFLESKGVALKPSPSEKTEEEG